MNRYRSFFWPGVLILAGVIALLVNTGVLPADRLWELIALWPLILVVIGLEIIVRRTLRGTAGDVAAALVVVIAIIAAAGYVTYAPNPAATNTRDYSSHVAGVTRGSVAIRVGAATISISSGGELGADLYHAHVEYSGPAPTVTFDSGGQLNIVQQNNSVFGNNDQRFVLTLQLSPSIPWSIEERSGASDDTLQLASLRVGSISIHTGASRDDISLGPAQGAVPVQINGGALTVRLHRPTGTSASVDVSGGAVTLVADGKDLHAIGKVSYTTGALGSDYYRIQVSGGACTVSLDTTTPSD